MNRHILATIILLCGVFLWGSAATAQVRVITLGTWWMGMVEPVSRVLDHYNRQHPGVQIIHEPIDAMHYDDVMERMLREGVGPDMLFLRSFQESEKLYNKGLLKPVDECIERLQFYPEDVRRPWTGKDGHLYGLPFFSVAHGIYYNKAIFKKYDLAIPETFEELLAVAKNLHEKGVLPFANTTGSRVASAEVIFLNLAPGFLGGVEGRKAYLSGERPLNDAHMLNLYKAVQALGPYLHENMHMMDRYNSSSLFLTGQAAMLFGGSWHISRFIHDINELDIGVFSTPAPKGMEKIIALHPDTAIGVNADSPSSNDKEIKNFIQWLQDPTVLQMLQDELPGMIPLSTAAGKSEMDLHSTFVEFTKSYESDIRFGWEGLRGGKIDSLEVIAETTNAVLEGRLSPENAVSLLHRSLESYIPKNNSGGKEQ
ncbi:MAG: ABC transporter substrate-binding protein [Desulfovibrio sp.]